MTPARTAARATVDGFGYEWTKFDQSKLDPGELRALFSEYFAAFPWDRLPPAAIGLDLGCGSGRWARLASAPDRRVVGVDASPDALRSAARNAPACPLVCADAVALPLRPASMQFGYSLGVLHHVPDAVNALAQAVELLEPGAPFLVYVYYALENRSPQYRAVWRASDAVRRLVSRAPASVRYSISQVLAAVVYLPLARLAAALEARGRAVSTIPLSAYRNRSFYTMRTDALDRFGTPIEERFTRSETRDLLERAGLTDVVVFDEPPFWRALGFKPAADAARP